MSRDKSSNPLTYIYHGLMFILKLIGSFFKYFFLGLIRFPILLGQMIYYAIIGIRNIFGGGKIKKETAEDGLLLEAKKEEKAKQQKEERLRNKIQNTKQKEINSDKLLDEDSPQKESFTSKIFSFLNKDIGAQKEINLPELKINFNGPDAVKSKTKQTYEYLIKNPEGKIV